MVVIDPNVKDISVSEYLGNERSSIFDVLTAQVGDYIETAEELESYLRSSRREYTEVIVYHTSTDYKQNFNRDELLSWYNIEYEISDINYHFLLLRDGRIQINKLINEETAHTNVENHVPYSISLAFVGGLNDGIQDIYTASGAQWKTFRKFMTCFYSILPGGQAFGHSDINLNAVDPGFDVLKYVENIFGKRNTLRNVDARELGSLDVNTLINESRYRGLR
jgi:hypothetical protein